MEVVYLDQVLCLRWIISDYEVYPNNISQQSATRRSKSPSQPQPASAGRAMG
jgi:hypothetical protein